MKNNPEIYKTLEYIGKERETIGKYAHPVEIKKEEFVWAGSDMPMLIKSNTTIETIKSYYKNLNFDNVILTTKILIDYE